MDNSDDAFESKKGRIELTGYTALITGASSGMGYEMAKELLSHGAAVIIGARNEAKLDKAYKQLSLQGGEVYKVPLDVSNEESVIKAAAWFEEHFDHLDMLVNNAGIGGNAPGMENLAPDHHPSIGSKARATALSP